jgi:hypothetical protein
MKRQEGDADYVMRSHINVFTQYYNNDQMKEDEMGGTCSTHTEIRIAK